MSDISGDILKIGKDEQRVCRVAYTLDNEQPVKCTIIDEQPLFYMDAEEDFEEEGLFDDTFEDMDFMALEGEILSLKHEVASFEKFEPESTDRIEEFLENARSVCSPHMSEEAGPCVNILVESLRKSRLACSYIDFAEECRVEILYSTQIEYAHYDRINEKILINPNLSTAEQILLTARELRRHWQHRQGALIHPLMFYPDNAILVNRVQLADLVTSMIRIAWELQLSGDCDAWKHVESSSMADLGQAFAREAFLDFRTLNNGQAAASVFECWFLSERCRQQDKILIQQMLADYRGYVFELEEGSEQVTSTLIGALGTMPYGKNYLAQYAHIIMEDPVFTEVRDRSNANFLWFIKFERSFRESERELQTNSDLSTGGDRPSVQRSDQDFSYDDKTQFSKQSADVIAIFPGSAADPQESRDKAEKSREQLRSFSENRRDKCGEGNNIVYFRRESKE